ncbi:putative P-type Ca(2+) transporter [Helianthus annuus]|nr:putative P-type Ca(2+) transporter [Helianthus annuus]
MGTWSSNQAIENSDIIMDGSFADLINMVDYGKCIYYNVQSFLQIVLNTTISCILIGFIETAAFGDASLTTFQLAFDIKAVISSILIFCQFFNLFNARELQKMNFFRGIHRHKEFWIATAMFIVSHAAFVMVQDILVMGQDWNGSYWLVVFYLVRYHGLLIGLENVSRCLPRYFTIDYVEDESLEFKD